MSVSPILIPQQDAPDVAVERYASQAGRSDGVLLLLPALGTSVRFYRPLARQLSARGLDVVLFEQRGHGHSPVRASRRCDWGFAELLTRDLPTVLDWIDQTLAPTRLTLMGHSLGGHLSACLTALVPDRIDGVILAASGSPHLECFKASLRWKIRFLRAVIPLSTGLLGYFAGDRLGFGGREATTLMQDWSSMAKDNVYVAAGMDVDLDAGVGRYTGPVLRLGYEEDSYAPLAAITAVSDKFASAEVSTRMITSDELGYPASHFQWVREPEVTVAAVMEWLEATDQRSSTCS